MNHITRIILGLVAVALLTVGLGMAPASAEDSNPLRQSFCAEVRSTTELPNGPTDVVGQAIGFDGEDLIFIVDIDSNPDSTTVESASGISTARYAFFSGDGFVLLRVGNWVFAITQGYDPGIIRYEARITSDTDTCLPPLKPCGTSEVVSACEVE